MTTSRTMTHRVTAVFTAAAFALTACSSDDAAGTDASDPEPTAAPAAEADDQASTDLDQPDAPVDAADDATDAAPDDAEEPVPFDPTQEILFKDYTFVPMFGGDGPTQPFSNLFLPDDVPWPATMELIQTAIDSSESSEPVHTTDGAFGTDDPDADVDTVMGFFYDRLPGDGWELAEERPGNGILWTQWLRRMPHENPERSYEVELRIEYLGPEREHGDSGVLRFWIRSNEVFAAYEG